MTAPCARHVLIAGYPHFIAELLVRRILQVEPESRITVLAARDHGESAPIAPNRIEYLPARAIHRGFGLPAPTLRDLRASVTDVYNFVSTYHLAVDKRRAEDINIQGTRHLLEFARSAPNLVRFNHYSTAFVAGNRNGIVLETELDQGQAFRNTFERTKFTAEIAIRRAMRDTPISVYRPSVVVGTSTDGVLSAIDGPRHLISAMVETAGRLPVSFPANLDGPFNVVPADFVAQAIHELSINQRALGETFHLVDPAPIRIRHAVELIADAAHSLDRVSPTGGRIGLASLLMGKLARAGGNYLSEFEESVFFSPSNTLQGLHGSGTICPPFHKTVRTLVGAKFTTGASSAVS
ncbi:MAG: nucleoside-diphosphate-sugar epimerase [Bradymonadia bacterium]|jgi:nucleoside-diphosphate-sugar epimerase